MISIKALAIILLIGHFGSMGYITSVLRRQIALLKLPINIELKNFRYVLFALSVGIFLGNLIPITIDGLTLFINLGRPAHLQVASILYAMSNAIIELLSAYLIWKLYQLAASTKAIADVAQEAADAANK